VRRKLFGLTVAEVAICLVIAVVTYPLADWAFTHWVRR
jgi:hypothetical protein